MIVHINKGMCALSINLKDFPENCSESLQLVIMPMITRCGEGGSPWFLHGCWPFNTTDVDIANPRPDFPVICINAEHTDCACGFRFPFNEHVWKLPAGRHKGMLRLIPNLPCPPLPVVQVMKEAKGKCIPPEYNVGSDCHLDFNKPKPPKPVKQCCVIAEFDIEIDPVCKRKDIESVCEIYPNSFMGEV